MRCNVGIKVLYQSYSANTQQIENDVNPDEPKQLR